ncbi:LOW QUALITY PROTEIN: lymphocyte antigen 6 complex locus protein G5c [Ctenodactylus gundi]
MNLERGKTVSVNKNPLQAPPFPKYLCCYRCLMETKELGFLRSDIGLITDSCCITLPIRNSSGPDIVVSDCRSTERMSHCSRTGLSPVLGFWIFSHCCFQSFCSDPQKQALCIH